jgi:hypothetical protein
MYIRFINVYAFLLIPENLKLPSSSTHRFLSVPEAEG